MLRKAGSYSKKYRHAYTRRSTVRSKNYIKAAPPSKVTKYVMGDIKKFYEGKFPFFVALVTEQDVNVRDNAIEASRMMIHRHLEDNFKENYYFRVCVYPHHVLRENKMLTGAGADRMQTGMTLSFGSAVGIAAKVKAGGMLFSVGVSERQHIPIVKKILRKTASKIPSATKVIVGQSSK